MRKRRLVVAEGESCYHVVSRVAGRELLFGAGEKEAMLRMMGRQSRFSGVEVLAWCFMGNHFHLLLRVPDKEKATAGWTEEDYVERLRRIGSERFTRELLADVERWRREGNTEAVGRVAASVAARLFDLSAFMKEFKQRFSVWYNAEHGRVGTLWEERFRSVLVEGGGGLEAGGGPPAGSGVPGSDLPGRALRAVSAYIDLNPLRAGLVSRPEDYRWCSYAAALGGDAQARRGMAAVTGRSRWSLKALAEYRLLLYGEELAQEREGGDSPDGRGTGRRGGVSRAESEAVIAGGGRLSMAAALRYRVRHFTEGAAIGGRAFLEGVFEGNRDWFGPRRKSGARRIRGTGADWQGVMSLRDLKPRESASCGVGPSANLHE